MLRNVDAKFFQITIRLGTTPRIEIRADARVRITPNQAKYRARTVGDDPQQAVRVLRRLLSKLKAAYPNEPHVAITVDDRTILDVP